PSISFYVVCETIEEVDKYWKKLTEGGMEMMPLDKYPWSERYAWVQDRFGITWQLSFGKMKDVGQKFTPTLMFTKSKAATAEQAIDVYISVFQPPSIVGSMRYDPREGDLQGRVAHPQSPIKEYVLMAMDSSLSHSFEIHARISLVVACESQEQSDHYWDRL